MASLRPPYTFLWLHYYLELLRSIYVSAIVTTEQRIYPPAEVLCFYSDLSRDILCNLLEALQMEYEKNNSAL